MAVEHEAQGGGMLIEARGDLVLPQAVPRDRRPCFRCRISCGRNSHATFFARESQAVSANYSVRMFCASFLHAKFSAVGHVVEFCGTASVAVVVPEPRRWRAKRRPA